MIKSLQIRQDSAHLCCIRHALATLDLRPLILKIISHLDLELLHTLVPKRSVLPLGPENLLDLVLSELLLDCALTEHDVNQFVIRHDLTLNVKLLRPVLLLAQCLVLSVQCVLLIGNVPLKCKSAMCQNSFQCEINNCLIYSMQQIQGGSSEFYVGAHLLTTLFCITRDTSECKELLLLGFHLKGG